jgi:mono/diheme cytochrome c family protein
MATLFRLFRMMTWNKRLPHAAVKGREKQAVFAQSVVNLCKKLIASAQGVAPLWFDPIYYISRENMHKIPGAFILIGLAVILSACSLSLASDITPPPGSEQIVVQQATQAVPASVVFPIVPPDLENGAILYNQECAPCHGTRGRGDGPQATQLSVPVAPLGLSDFSRQFTPTEWYTVVTQGNMEKFMPPFGNLTDRQRWDVIAYAMSLSTTNELIAQGKTLFRENCTACHGLTGKGNGTDAGKLSNRPVDLTSQSIMAQTSASSLYQAISSGIIPDMPAYGNSLDDNERWALVSYLRSLTFAQPAGSVNAYPAPQAYPSPVVTQKPQVTATVEMSPTTPFTGTVSVQLINGSGGDSPSGVPVTLYGFDNMQNTYSETLSTEVDGVYTFTDVFMPEGRVFLAGTDYASATYGSDVVSVEPANPNLNLQVRVFESTTDVSVLTTDRVHIFFDFTDPQNAQIIEVFIISNPTDLAVISSSEGGAVVTFPLPDGYTNLEFQDGELGNRYVEVAGGFADTMSVKPGVGEYQVIFAFQMPYNRKLDFAQSMFLPTTAVVVMVPDNGIKVDSDQLQDGGTRDFQGSTYHMYNGSNLLAGSSLEFTLSGKPKNTSAPAINSGPVQNLAIGLGVFGIVLLVVGLWLFNKNRKKTARKSSIAGTDLDTTDAHVEDLSEDEETLMDAIIALDDQFRAGKLPEDAYLERRAVLKDKLRKISPG